MQENHSTSASIFFHPNGIKQTYSIPGLLFAVLLFTSFLVGCQTSESGTVLQDEYFETFVFETVAQGYRATITDTTETDFRDADEWNQFATNLTPIGKMQEVDFETMMVVVAVIPATSGGYSIAFDSVDLIDEELVATYTISTPGLDCMIIAALTQPFQAISVRKMDGDVVFKHSTIRDSCSL